MKAVILAGGYGTRISEESHLRPKPMIEIGGQPLLWHIMKFYHAYGVNEFIVCAGYMQEMIRAYFADARVPWDVTVVDTGLHTMTGGRLLRVRKILNDEPFFFTYGDGVADIDLGALLAFHKKMGRLATVTAVRVEQRFGVIRTDENGLVTQFREKNQEDRITINGGFMVLEPGVFNYIDGDEIVFEQGPMERLAADRQLAAYRYSGFWQCMDTQREKKMLEELWGGGNAPWKVW